MTNNDTTTDILTTKIIESTNFLQVEGDKIIPGVTTASQVVVPDRVTTLTEKDIKNELFKMMRGRKSTVKRRGHCKGLQQ